MSKVLAVIEHSSSVTPGAEDECFGGEKDDGELFNLLKWDGLEDNLDVLLSIEEESGHSTCSYCKNDTDDTDDSDSLIMEAAEGEEVWGKNGSYGDELFMQYSESDVTCDRSIREEGIHVNGDVDVDVDFVRNLELEFMTDISKVSHELGILRDHSNSTTTSSSHQCDMFFQNFEEHYNPTHDNKHHYHQHHHHEHDHHHNHTSTNDVHDKKHKNKMHHKRPFTGGGETSQSLATLATASWDTEDEEEQEKYMYGQDHAYDPQHYYHYEQQYAHEHDHQHSGHHYHYHHYHHHYHYHHYGYTEQGEDSAHQSLPNNTWQKQQRKRHYDEHIQPKDYRGMATLKAHLFDASEAALLEQEIENGLLELERILQEFDEEEGDQLVDRNQKRTTTTSTNDNRDQAQTTPTPLSSSSSSMHGNEASTNARIYDTCTNDGVPRGISSQIVDEFLNLDRCLQEQLQDFEVTVQSLDHRQSSNDYDYGQGEEGPSSANGIDPKNSNSPDAQEEDRREGSQETKDDLQAMIKGKTLYTGHVECISLSSFVRGSPWYPPMFLHTKSDPFSIIRRHLENVTVPYLYPRTVPKKASITNKPSMHGKDKYSLGNPFVVAHTLAPMVASLGVVFAIAKCSGIGSGTPTLVMMAGPSTWNLAPIARGLMQMYGPKRN